MRGRAVVCAAALAVILLPGCSSDSGEASASGESGASPGATSSTPTPSPTPTPTPTPEIVLWAGEVCVARDAFVDTLVEFAKNLEYDPSSGEDVGQQFQRQLEDNLDEFTVASDNLGAALGKVPLDYAKALPALAGMQENVDALNVAKDEALARLGEARSAGDPVNFGLALMQAGISAKEAYDAGSQVAEGLSELSQATEGDAGEAFRIAPECGGTGILPTP